MDQHFQVLEIILAGVALLVGTVTTVTQSATSGRSQANVAAAPIRYLRWLAYALLVLLITQSMDVFGPRLLTMGSEGIVLKLDDFRLRDGAVLAVCITTVLALWFSAKSLFELEQVMRRYGASWED